MNEQKNAAIEEKCVTDTAILTLTAQQARSDNLGLSAPLLESGVGVGFNTIAGVVSQSDQERFARTIFRASRGNAFTYFQAIPYPLKDPKSNKDVSKAVFVIYFQDMKSSTSAMCDKIKKICQAFGVNIYRWPTDKGDAEKRRAYIDGVISDKSKALGGFERFMTNEAQSLLSVQR